MYLGPYDCLDDVISSCISCLDLHFVDPTQGSEDFQVMFWADTYSVAVTLHTSLYCSALQARLWWSLTTLLPLPPVFLSVTADTFQKGQMLVVWGLGSVNRNFFCSSAIIKIVLCLSLLCFTTSSSSSHKITTLHKHMFWRPRGINSLLWHSSSRLLWSQYLPNLF